MRKMFYLKPQALFFAPVTAALLATSAGADPALEAGNGVFTVSLGRANISLYLRHPDLRHPDSCEPRGAVLVFHGRRRNATDYLEYAEQLAEKHCLLLAAPRFDAEHFSSRRYQRGGIMKHGKPAPHGEWASTIVKRLVNWMRAYQGDPHLPIWLFGHSAGGQFLSRAAAFDAPDGIERIVVANPSSYVLPSLQERAPYGLAGIYSGETEEQALASYLAQPLTLYLGGRDTGKRHLDKHPAARRQGKNRLQRGLHIYEQGRVAAQHLGVPFGWKLVVAPDVGHNARSMLHAPQLREAMDLPEPPHAIAAPAVEKPSMAPAAALHY